jgi:hypothetical protein
MELFFLSADVPLTKTYTLGDSGKIEKSAYPLVRDFTSHQEQVETIEQFCDALRQHAELGHCLLKGKLSRPLHGESRAGSTNAQDNTQWLCLDLDGAEGFASIDAFVTSVLPAEFHDVDYILQYSASAGVTSGTGIRAHLFYLASVEFPAPLAKDFVTGLNFDNALLASQLTLTAAGTALRYPLDRTVNQPDKLIYIAPPILGHGVTENLASERITLIRKQRRDVDFSRVAIKTPAQLEHLQATKVAELRAAANLPKKKIATSRQAGMEVATNPDVARVTGERRGRGYVYLNLNGGDSWGYFYPEENPTYLYNFKGEPIVRLEDIVPDYYHAIPKPERADVPAIQSEHGGRPFVFREHASDKLYAGEWSDIENRMITDVQMISERSLRHFFALRGGEVPDPIEEWRYEFDPTTTVRFDAKSCFVNKFEATKYLSAEPKLVKMFPPTIEYILHSVTGGDVECFDHFLNWLAFIYQTREKTGVAWIFHGIQGTGKGVMFNHIIAPIFGEKYCSTRGLDSFEDRFNGGLDRCLFMNYDEARADDSARAKKLVNKLKNWITEPFVAIRAMRTEEIQVRSYTNFLFFSNDYDAWAIEPSDRRFNVAPRQEKKIVLTGEDIERIETELTHFASFLAGYQVDEQRARTALNNDAKAKLREASQDTTEQFCQAIVDGNLEYFATELEATANLGDIVNWSNYQNVLRVWISGANQKTVVKQQEISHAYMYLVATGEKAAPKKKFQRLLAHKNLIAGAHYCATAKKSVRGFLVEWKASAEQLEQWRALLDKKQPRDQVDNLGAWTAPISKSA